MELFTENKHYFLAVSIGATVVVLIVSIVYTTRNILRVWNAGNPRTMEPNPTKDELEDELEDSEKENIDEKPVDREIDPLQYCEHIQSEVKKARQRVATKEIRQNLTAEEMQKEREVQRKQIEDIFKLMEQHSDKFGVASEEDVRQQMKLYV